MKEEKRIIRVSYEFHIEYFTEKGLEKALNELKKRPVFGLSSSEGFRIKIKEKSGEVCQF